MGRNEGTTDRVVRAVLAVVAVVAALAVGAGSVGGVALLVVAAILAVTAAAGFCPLYRVIGMSTPSRAECRTTASVVLTPSATLMSLLASMNSVGSM